LKKAGTSLEEEEAAGGGWNRGFLLGFDILPKVERVGEHSLCRIIFKSPK
jgi:hypothetical protein